MPGTIGNTNSKKSNRLYADTIRKIAVQNPHKLTAIAEALFDKAMEGDLQAAKEIGDRLDGKAPTVIAGDDDNPLTIIHKIERLIIDGSANTNT